MHSILAPLAKSLDEQISSSLIEHFPIWSDFCETREVLRGLILHSLQGVAVDHVASLSGERLQRLLDLLASTAISEFKRADNQKRAAGD